MPDELDALRQFRGETPGPSTDAWNRARAAIAAARAEEEPAGRVPGRRPPGRKPGRRRVLWLAAAGAVAAAVAGLLAVLLPGLPASRGTGTQVEATAFVTHVERALSRSSQRNVVGYASTEYPPGYNAVVLSPGDLRVGPSADPNSPWNVRHAVRWSYQHTVKVTAFTTAGNPIFILRSAQVRGTQTVTGVMYRSGTWWRGTIGPAPAANPPAPSRCGPGVELGSGGWPVFLRQELSCGEFTESGQQRIGRIEAVELTGNSGREVFWVNPRTYLPVRAIFRIAGARILTDFGWFAPTRARLAELHQTVPPGFRQVRAP